MNISSYFGDYHSLIRELPIPANQWRHVSPNHYQLSTLYLSTHSPLRTPLLLTFHTTTVSVVQLYCVVYTCTATAAVAAWTGQHVTLETFCLQYIHHSYYKYTPYNVLPRVPTCGHVSQCAVTCHVTLGDMCLLFVSIFVQFYWELSERIKISSIIKCKRAGGETFQFLYICPVSALRSTIGVLTIRPI